MRSVTTLCLPATASATCTAVVEAIAKEYYEIDPPEKPQPVAEFEICGRHSLTSQEKPIKGNERVLKIAQSGESSLFLSVRIGNSDTIPVAILVTPQ